LRRILPPRTGFGAGHFACFNPPGFPGVGPGALMAFQLPRAFRGVGAALLWNSFPTGTRSVYENDSNNKIVSQRQV